MGTQTTEKPMTLDDLAAMVADGFADITSRMATKDDIANMATKDDIANMATKDDIAQLRTEMLEMKTELKAEIEGLRNSVNNYLRLSDERYLELKRQNEIYAKWFKLISEKIGITLDFQEIPKL
jgi:hypothetical protein